MASTISGLVGTTYSSTSFVDSVLGTSSGSGTSGTGGLVDYALIKSGAYKKLMSAYYAQESTSTNAAEQKRTLTTTQSASQDLAKSTNKLMKSDYTEDNRKNLLSTFKDWVDDYNALIESTDDVEDTATLRQVLWMTQQTSANEGLLGQMGITVNADNTLSIDEDKFNEAKMTTMKTLFVGAGSYGSQITAKAAASYAAATSALNESSSASAYTRTGSAYTGLNTSSIIDSIT